MLVKYKNLWWAMSLITFFYNLYEIFLDSADDLCGTIAFLCGIDGDYNCNVIVVLLKGGFSWINPH